LEELTTAYADARADPKFWKEWENEFGYMNRPSQLYEAKRLTEHCGGARIWFKREDLNHTGSHKVRLRSKTIVQPERVLIVCCELHRSTTLLVRSCSLEGLERNVSSLKLVPDNTVLLPLPFALNSVWSKSTFPSPSSCFLADHARFDRCIVYMGEEDVRRQALNVFRMRMLGAKVVAVASGTRTLKDAISKLPLSLLCISSVTDSSFVFRRSDARLGYQPFDYSLPRRIRDWSRTFPNHCSRLPIRYWTRDQESNGRFDWKVTGCCYRLRWRWFERYWYFPPFHRGQECTNCRC